MQQQRKERRRAKKLDKKAQGQYTGGIRNFCSHQEHRPMGQSTHTTKFSLSLDKRDQGGANCEKHALLDATVQVLTQARTFYLDFFLAHADKLAERVAYYSEKHMEMRERAISANELLSLLPKPARWKRKSILMPGLTGTSPKRSPLCPVCTAAASSRMPRASCGRTCPIGRTGKKVAKRRGDLDSLEEATIPPSTKGLSLSNWTASICARPLCGGSVYTGQSWKWVNYPVRYSRYAGAAAHRAWVGRAQSEVGRTQTRS